ncbi:heparan-alpha-glucosaminide N-acetyltransferase-like [Zingiber officinale]|uniref:heparan-alpha-glucosaminide N-acetyltransferase-like n=1 Tax=Zingiber officinale TaxID=94328 RepID=UPI001C4CCF4F|nr:heparan-alpha-glucosaminide N-acetyltransferase-like [Zingiber officinale]
MGAYELIKGEENAGAAALEALHSTEDLETICDASWKKDKPSASAVATRNRLVSLDVFRGLTVALMIFVDYAGGFLPAVNHSPWNGIALADFVMPFFLFIVGVALSLTYKRVPNKVLATKKVILRASKLFLVGLIVQGGYFHGLRNLNYGVDMSKIRWMGVLQRIAIAYLFAAICEIWLKTDDNIDSGSSVSRLDKLQLLLCLVLTAIYTILLYGLYVPDWQYEIPAEGFTTKFFSVKCGVRGDTGPSCNAVGMIDRKILGIQHLHHHPVYERMKQCSIYSPASGPLPFDAPSWCQAPFDPEGVLSSVMAIVTCLIGLQFGHVIIQMKHHKARIIHWAIPSLFLITLACIMEVIGMHINKPLYSVSYTCITTGAAGILFTVAYVLVDVFGYRRPTLAMEWLGKHALMVYILIGCNILPVLIQGFYWKEPQNNLLRLIGIH